MASQSSTSTAQLSCDGALKTELYNAPRRSLRQKGVHAEGSGFPYYSPSKLRQFQGRGRSRTTSPAGDKEGEKVDTTSYNHEVITVGGDTETGQKSNTLTRRDTRSEIEEEAAPKRTKTADSSLNLSEPSENIDRVDNRRTSLRNSSVRRQIIRPWEDKMEKSLSPLDPVPTLSVKSPLPNGTANLPSEIPDTNPNFTQSEQSLPSLTKHTKRRSSSISVSSTVRTVVKVNTGTSSQAIPEDMAVSCLELSNSTEVSNDVQTGRSKSKKSPSEDMIPASQVHVRIDRGKLLSLFEKVTVSTDDSSCEEMERLHATFQHLVFRYRMTTDRSKLVEVSLYLRLYSLMLHFNGQYCYVL